MPHPADILRVMAHDPNQHWRKGMIAHLLSLYDAARLEMGIRHIHDDATPEQLAELRRPGVELYQALFQPTRRIAWRCPTSRRPGQHGVLHSPKLFEVTNRRLAIIPVQRAQALPSGWRPERWLIVDRRFLAEENHPGFHLPCPLCDRIHSFDAKALRKQTDGSTADYGEPAGSRPPSGYPSAEHAAVAELWGPYSDLDTELAKATPELYVYLTPHRKERLQAELKKHPGAPIYPFLLAGPALRTTDPSGETRLQPATSPYDETQRIWEQPDPS